VKAAAKIIKEEIREIKFHKELYPSINEITSLESWSTHGVTKPKLEERKTIHSRN